MERYPSRGFRRKVLKRFGLEVLAKYWQIKSLMNWVLNLEKLYSVTSNEGDPQALFTGSYLPAWVLELLI